MNYKLEKICPFCGSDNAFVHVIYDDCVQIGYSIVCHECGINTGVPFVHLNDAIKFWETRAIWNSTYEWGYSNGYCEGFIRAWNTQAETRKCCADCSFFSYDVKLECGICNKPSISTIIDETDRVCRWFSESKDDSDRIERLNHGKHQYRMR